MKRVIPITIILVFFSTCKKIDEDWLTPVWIQEKIEDLSSSCIYDGSSIVKYEWDSIYYIGVNIPNDWWPDDDVYYEDGSQVIFNDSDLKFYSFSSEREEIETIWEFSDDGCSD
jgi:hypothetical protein